MSRIFHIFFVNEGNKMGETVVRNCNHLDGRDYVKFCDRNYRMKRYKRTNAKREKQAGLLDSITRVLKRKRFDTIAVQVEGKISSINMANTIYEGCYFHPLEFPDYPPAPG
jgi:hypothetical protein